MQWKVAVIPRINQSTATLKQGIIAKTTVNRLMKVAEQAAKDDQTETTAAKLGELYQQTSS